MSEQTFLEAIRAGLHEEMSRDSAVYVFGEDVSLGGPFGVTKGLAEDFGAPTRGQHANQRRHGHGVGHWRRYGRIAPGD